MSEATSLASSVSLLELASNNCVGSFREAILVGVDLRMREQWYCRQNQNGLTRMVIAERSPLMIAALYGSLDVMSYLLSLPQVDVNEASSSDGCTALHCAAQGGSPRAAEAVSMLISYGANRDIADSSGRRPFEMISISPKLPHVRSALERQLRSSSSSPVSRALAPQLTLPSPPDDSPDVPSSPNAASSPQSPASSSSSFYAGGLAELSQAGSSSSSSSSGSGTSARDFPLDPNVPDFKSSVYTSDDFRMFNFKVRPCSRAYSHDWTECPFVHPGENARRRDPRRFQYSCVPCPDFRKGSCRRGDACEYAHGVFECWLHPAQYRTRLCKDGTSCARRVCFFAHTSEELRPLHIAAGSSLPSIPSPSLADMRSIMSSSDIPPPSPSSVLMLSQLASPAVTPNTPPQSPSANSKAWAAAMQGNPSPISLPAGGLAHVTSPSGIRRAKSVHVSREMTIPEEGEPSNEALAQLMLQQQMNQQTQQMNQQKQQMRLQQQIQLQMSQQQHWQLQHQHQQQQQEMMGIDSHKRHMSDTDVSRLALELAQLQMIQQAQAMAASLATSPPPGGFNSAVGSGPVPTLDSMGSTSAANQQQPLSPLMHALAQQADMQKLSPLGRTSSMRQSVDLGVMNRAGNMGGNNGATMGSLASHLQRQVLLQQLQLQKQLEMEHEDARKQALDRHQAKQQQQQQQQQEMGGEEKQGSGGGVGMEGQWRNEYVLNSPSPPKRSPDWSFSAGSPKWSIPAGPPVSSSSVTSPPHGGAPAWSQQPNPSTWK